MKQLDDIPWKARQQTDKELIEKKNDPHAELFLEELREKRSWLVETASGEFVADCRCGEDAEIIARSIALLPELAETWRMLLCDS